MAIRDVTTSTCTIDHIAHMQSIVARGKSTDTTWLVRATCTSCVKFLAVCHTSYHISIRSSCTALSQRSNDPSKTCHVYRRHYSVQSTSDHAPAGCLQCVRNMQMRVLLMNECVYGCAPCSINWIYEHPCYNHIQLYTITFCELGAVPSLH